MRNFLRSPLTWMVVAELIVVSALIAVAWTVVAAASRPAVASPAVVGPDSSGDVASPLPELPIVTQGPRGPRGPLPGLNLDSRFWRTRLAQLNRDQALFVQLEWRLIHSAMDAIRGYLDTVVLPAIERAENRGPGEISAEASDFVRIRRAGGRPVV